MKEATFITMSGITKVCSIPDDVKFEYSCLISTIRKELLVQDEYRIKMFREGCEDALNPSSDFQSGDKYFVLYEQLSQEKTDELRNFFDSNQLKFINKLTVVEATKKFVYDKVEKLINDGACVESLYSKSNFDDVGVIKDIIPHIVRYNDIQLLKLLLNNGLDIDSPPIKTHFLQFRSVNGNSIVYDMYTTSYKTNKIYDTFISYKIDLRYHFDMNSHDAMRRLGYKHVLLSHAISENIIELNTLIPSNNSALFYYVLNLGDFVETYNLKVGGNITVNYNLPSGDGTTFLCMDSICYCTTRVFEKRLEHYPQIDINLQYYITSDKHKKTTRFGDTFLHMLCRCKPINFSKIQLLLDRGVKIIENEEGETQIDILKTHPYTKTQHKLLNILEKCFDMPITEKPVKPEKPIEIPNNIEKYFNVPSEIK